jgi:predicted nucleotidyltransferase
MRNNQRLVSTLAALKPGLQSRYGVVQIGFCSWWTNQKDVTSDITIIVELSRPLGWEFYALKAFLEYKLKMSIDLATWSGIKPMVREEVKQITRFV